MLVKNYVLLACIVIFIVGLLTIVTNIEKIKEYNSSDHYTYTTMKLHKWEVESECTSTFCQYVGGLSLRFKLYNKDFDCKVIQLHNPVSRNRTEIENYMQDHYIIGGDFSAYFDSTTLNEEFITCYFDNPRPIFPTTILIIGTVLMCTSIIMALFNYCLHRIMEKQPLISESS